MLREVSRAELEVNADDSQRWAMGSLDVRDEGGARLDGRPSAELRVVRSEPVDGRGGQLRRSQQRVEFVIESDGVPNDEGDAERRTKESTSRSAMRSAPLASRERRCAAR